MTSYKYNIAIGYPFPQPPSYHYMSLEVYKFQLAHSPHYIMNNLHTTASPNTLSRPSSPTFILCPVSPISTNTDLSLDNDSIPNGVHIEDPIDKFMIPNLPEHIWNPRLPSAVQVFAIFNTSPYLFIPVLPLPLDNLKKYNNKHVHNSVYHITVSIDTPSIILDQAGMDDPKSFFFYLQQVILSRAYQVYSGLLDWHQMTLIANLAITNYRSKGVINLPALQNDMICPQPEGIFSHSIHALFHHLIVEWLATLECIWYKANTVCWLNVISTRTSPLAIKEYVPKGLLPEALFPLNPKGVHRVSVY